MRLPIRRRGRAPPATGRARRRAGSAGCRRGQATGARRLAHRGTRRGPRRRSPRWVVTRSSQWPCLSRNVHSVHASCQVWRVPPFGDRAVENGEQDGMLGTEPGECVPDVGDRLRRDTRWWRAEGDRVAVRVQQSGPRRSRCAGSASTIRRPAARLRAGRIHALGQLRGVLPNRSCSEYRPGDGHDDKAGRHQLRQRRPHLVRRQPGQARRRRRPRCPGRDAGRADGTAWPARSRSAW